MVMRILLTPRSGVYFAAAERRIAEETGPVRLESVQARLAQCIYLLGSSRINQAWYTFGTASQMVHALGIHRKRFSQSLGGSSNLLEVEMRKRVFWAAYTLDKYLSIILGRPRVFRDEEIDQHFPERLSDADLIASLPKPKAAQSQCVSDGPVFHAKYVACYLRILLILSSLMKRGTTHTKQNRRLVRIVSRISNDLYPTNKDLSTDWMETAQKITAELKIWKKSLPPFLEPDKVDPTVLIPIFQRQSTVLRLAYLNALILANRPSLLSNFADLNRSQNPPSGELNSTLKECIDAASAVVEIVNGFIEQSRMRKPFWFTHYISFCAISTLYVYAIQQSQPGEQPKRFNNATSRHLQHFEAAEICQQNIYATTAPSSPFRRYNIILDELKKEVLLRLGRATPPSNNSLGKLATMVHEPPRLPCLMDSSSGASSRAFMNSVAYPVDFGEMGQLIEQENQGLMLQNYSQGIVPGDFRMANTATQSYDESMLDLGLLGPQDELVGWAELDSCVSCFIRTLGYGAD
jgi:Fungal specific transcription factor domain